MEQQEPICTVRGELNGKRLRAKRLPKPVALDLFGGYRVGLKEFGWSGFVSWSQDGQLVGYACSPGYVREKAGA